MYGKWMTFYNGMCMGNLRLPVYLRSSDFLEKIISVCLSNYISLSGKQILIGLLMTTE